MRLAVVAALFFSLVPRLEAGEDKSYLSVALTKTEDEQKLGDGVSKRSITVMNISGVLGVGSGVVAGLKYFDYSYDDSFLGDDGTKTSGYGPLIGYAHTSGFYGHLAYLLSPEKTSKDSDGTTTYNGSYGYVVDIGKSFEVTKSFGVALQLSQSRIYFKNVKNANGEKASLTGTWYDASLYPYLAAMVFF